MTLRRLGHRRLHPGAGERRARPARPQQLRAAAVGRSDGARGPDVLRHRQPRRHAVRGRPPPGAASATSTGPASGASRSTSPPRWSSSTSRDGDPSTPPQPARQRRRTSTSPPPTSPATCASAPSTRSRRWASRSSTRSTRTRPSQHEIDLRYTDALTMADNVMTFRLVVREIAPRAGRVRHVHAQAARRRAGLGHAHPLVALRGRRPTPSTTPGDPLRASPRSPGASSPACSRHAREITAVTNQSVNSYKRLIVGLRGAGVRQLGPQQPLGARAGARHQVGQGGLDPHRVPGARPGVQPLPRLLGDARRRAKGIEEGYELPTEASANVFELTDEERPPRASIRCRSRCREALDVMEQSELVAEALGEHIFEWFLRNKRAEWHRLQDAGHASSSSTATCRNL